MLPDASRPDHNPMTRPELSAFMSRHFPGVIILIESGDFVEAIGTHAETVAPLLGLTLTTQIIRGDRLPMCGFPTWALAGHLATLNQAGHRVEIAAYRPGQNRP